MVVKCRSLLQRPMKKGQIMHDHGTIHGSHEPILYRMYSTKWTTRFTALILAGINSPRETGGLVHPFTWVFFISCLKQSCDHGRNWENLTKLLQNNSHIACQSERILQPVLIPRNTTPVLLIWDLLIFVHISILVLSLLWVHHVNLNELGMIMVNWKCQNGGGFKLCTRHKHLKHDKAVFVGAFTIPSVDQFQDIRGIWLFYCYDESLPHLIYHGSSKEHDFMDMSSKCTLLCEADSAYSQFGIKSNT